MFTKLLLSLFPDSFQNNVFSPAYFHLQMISSEMFYYIILKKISENRRVNFSDMQFSYIEDKYNEKLSIGKSKNYYFSYKNFAMLNWYKNYNVSTISFVLSLIAFRFYHNEIKKNKLENYYVWFLDTFFAIWFVYMSKFKDYPESATEEEKFKLFLEVLENLFYYKLKDKNNSLDKTEIVAKFKKVILTDIKFLYFVFKITQNLTKTISCGNSPDIIKWIAWGVITDNSNLSAKLQETAKHIYIKKYTSFINYDFMSLIDLIIPEYTYISYLFITWDKAIYKYLYNGLDWIDNTKDQIDNIWKNRESSVQFQIKEVIDYVLKLDNWKQSFFGILKKYDSDVLTKEYGTQSPNIEEFHEIMVWNSNKHIKDMLQVNENFMDFYIAFWSNIYSWDWYNLEFSNFSSLNNVISEYCDSAIYSTHLKDSIKNIFYIYDLNFFNISNRLRHKDKNADNKRFLIYDSTDNILFQNILKNWIFTLFQDFNTKTNKIKITNAKCCQTYKTHFQDNIKWYISKKTKKSLIKYYFEKKLWNVIDYKLLGNIEDHFVTNFKNNIYTTDFVVFDRILTPIIEYFKENWYFKDKWFLPATIIFLGKLRETIFGYIIARWIIKYWNYENKQQILNSLDYAYSSTLFSTLSYQYINLELIQLIWIMSDAFINKYNDFAMYFITMDDNIKFINSIWIFKWEIISIPSIPNLNKKLYTYLWIYDVFKSIQLYNRRYMK